MKRKTVRRIRFITMLLVCIAVAVSGFALLRFRGSMTNELLGNLLEEGKYPIVRVSMYGLGNFHYINLPGYNCV